jgi:hypothetical protein
MPPRALLEYDLHFPGGGRRGPPWLPPIRDEFDVTLESNGRVNEGFELLAKPLITKRCESGVTICFCTIHPGLLLS